MADIAEHSKTPAGYYEKPGGANLPPDLIDSSNHLRNINGITNKIVIVPTAMHEAYTNMSYISLSGEYLSMAMKENYHGYPAARLREDLDFVIQHEIGHLNVHPGQSLGWKDEIAAMPVEGSKKMSWANVLSDIIVNYNIANGTQLDITGPEWEKESRRMHNAIWNAYGGGFRSCYDGQARMMGATIHNDLVDGKSLVDNRYDNGKYEPHAIGNPYLPSPETPEYQKFMGHGRGPQLYPSIAHCVAHKMPVGTDMGPGMGLSRTSQDFPDNWKQIQLLATLPNVEYSPNASKWLGYNPTPGVCPITGGATESRGPVSAGTYTVLNCKTYDGIDNPKEVRPIEFYQIDYNGTPRWIPSHYCIGTCPHCGQVSPSQFQLGMGYKPDIAAAVLVSKASISPGMAQQIEKTRLYNVLLCNLLAGMYATSSTGFNGQTGRQAGLDFLNACAWDRHLCMIGR